MNFVDSWNKALSFLPEGLLVTCGVIGVVLIVAFIGIWLWRGRSGGGVSAKSFPWMVVIIGGLLAAPKVVVPVLLGIAEIIVSIVIAAVNGIMGWF